jgi:hypothetical protein
MLRFEDINFHNRGEQPISSLFAVQGEPGTIVQERSAFVLFPNGVLVSVQQKLGNDCRFPNPENRDGSFEVALLTVVGGARPNPQLLHDLDMGYGAKDGVACRVVPAKINRILEAAAQLPDQKGNYELGDIAELFLSQISHQIQIAEEPDEPAIASQGSKTRMVYSS